MLVVIMGETKNTYQKDLMQSKVTIKTSLAPYNADLERTLLMNTPLLSALTVQGGLGFWVHATGLLCSESQREGILFGVLLLTKNSTC